MKSSLNPKRPLSTKLGLSFLISGILSLATSILLTSEIFAFIGLGLTFWGALLLIITPSRYVEGQIAADSSYSIYITTDRIIKQLGYEGKGFHIPPYPEEVYVPEHLKGLKELVVFIPAAEETDMIPSIEEIAKGKFMLKDPKGILLSPPGLQLLNKIEEKSKANYTKTSVTDLCEILPKNILNNYSLAKEITMTIGNNEIVLEVADSIYNNLYKDDKILKSINLLGCPLVSAIACAIAKSSGKPTIIQTVKSFPDVPVMKVQYKIF